MDVFDAGEFSDVSYLENPINRSFFCKDNLYHSIAGRSDLPILSGTNLDALKDFRPGLMAAKQHAVRHSYVEAMIDKTTIRKVARQMGLSEISELPAAPCLSSNVSTGVRINTDDLTIIDRIETAILDQIGSVTARCRLTKEGFLIEIEA